MVCSPAVYRLMAVRLAVHDPDVYEWKGDIGIVGNCDSESICDDVGGAWAANEGCS